MTGQDAKPMHSMLVERFLSELKQASTQGAILDLACGSGRNGLYLARQGIPVVFADQDSEKLSQIEQAIQDEQLAARTWLVDFETGQPLAGRQFGAIMVFRYLHRPLFEAIKASIAYSGLVIYETFNIGQRAYGRPHNPDFLLQDNELVDEFGDWQILHQFEGVVSQPNSSISQIVVRR
ncbi:methyltransferase domain-containing protein [Photobacterium chitinilyticum]|uniref:Methyltransferase domain-containing protein n=1 Tax=Photobacterium chitinilyticum TaxID=2485123 RepID=A0A444JWX5_9GAMM|nr:methyltransferase domain-containing protein [Photobacterium chitinilyticum]RWX57576.1 methyltransferase domain-containing protein [Photobacterium chitinilyticum]